MGKDINAVSINKSINQRARKYAFQLIADAIEKGDIDSAIEYTMRIPAIMDGYLKRSYAFVNTLEIKQIEIPSWFDELKGNSYIELYAISHRLKRRLVAYPSKLQGRKFLNSILREFAYLPAMQYMFDTHIQVPAIWRRFAISESSNILRANGVLQGVRFQISDVYAADFFPLKIGSSVRPDSVALPENAVFSRYLKQMYRYLSKIQYSKISGLMERAFGGEISVSYILTNASDLKPSGNSVSFFITVPMIAAGKIIPRLNLIVRITMLNGAEIRFVDNTVSTYPVIFTDAKRYIPNFQYSTIVASPTTLSMVLTETNVGDVQ